MIFVTHEPQPQIAWWRTGYAAPGTGIADKIRHVGAMTPLNDAYATIRHRRRGTPRFIACDERAFESLDDIHWVRDPSGDYRRSMMRNPSDLAALEVVLVKAAAVHAKHHPFSDLPGQETSGTRPSIASHREACAGPRRKPLQKPGRSPRL